MKLNETIAKAFGKKVEELTAGDVNRALMMEVVYAPAHESKDEGIKFHTFIGDPELNLK